MKKCIKILAAVLLLSMLCLAFTACTSSGKPVMTLGDKSISVNTYQFLLSRVKSNVETYYDNAKKDGFWNIKMDLAGTTYADYFEASALEQASLYLAAEYLFDRNGLILTAEREEMVDKLMDTLVKLNGSKTNLNADLKNYGFNYDMLRQLYITETKIDMLKDHLYGEKGEKIDAEVKEEYLSEHYVALGQLFLPTYSYLKATDRFGNEIYFTDDKQKTIAYDKVNGTTKINEFGLVEKDANGDPVYFGSDGKIAYDKVNGVTAYLTDKDGNKVAESFNDEDKKKVYEAAQNYALATNGSIETFLEYCEKYDESGSEAGEYVYLFSDEGYYSLYGDASSYLDDMTNALDKMKVGECRVIESNYGYHIICKYELEEGAYDNEKHKDVFLDFYDNLIAELFEAECKKYDSSITLNVEAYESAPSIAEVKSNSLY